jgi:competence ComEA-like helix-hairpin-helix protein
MGNRDPRQQPPRSSRLIPDLSCTTIPKPRVIRTLHSEEKAHMARTQDKTGRVDVNSADAEELTRIEGIGIEHAHLILAHRERHGGFQSWEEFEQVLGIDPVLTEQARASAVLGKGKRPGGAEATPLKPAAELDEVEVLTTLAQLDLEAALAYDACAEAVELAGLRSHLVRFRDDHFRHVDAINRVLEKRGGKAVERESSGQLLRRIARVASALGSHAGLIALLTNEELTNEAYDMASELEWDSGIEQMLERHAADEKLHFEWLSSQMDELEDEDSEQPEAYI